MTEVYLGDGLYASHDGYQLKLRAPREDGDHEVYLEVAVWKALLEFMEQTPFPGGDKTSRTSPGPKKLKVV